MSIQSEITRITNKRDQSFAKVAAKGVIVPSGSTIDDLPDLIDQISGGSLWSSGIYQDINGYICVSPNGGAAGILQSSSYLVVSQ